ncbi:hypothetical protein DSECCO2_356130 [anaerobic digester metagenome]
MPWGELSKSCLKRLFWMSSLRSASLRMEMSCTEPSRCMMDPSRRLTVRMFRETQIRLPSAFSVPTSKFCTVSCCRTRLSSRTRSSELRACRRNPWARSMSSSTLSCPKIRAMAGFALSRSWSREIWKMPSVAFSKMDRCFFSLSRRAFSVALREMAMARWSDAEASTGKSWPAKRRLSSTIWTTTEPRICSP